MAKVSFLIATKNCFNKLDSLMLSLFRQEEQDFEIICIDAGSKDGSVTLIEQYAKLDERVFLLKTSEKASVGACFALGLEKAKGAYVVLLNGGHHLLLPQMFAKRLLDSAQQNNSDIVYAQETCIDDKYFTAYKRHFLPGNFFTQYLNMPVFSGKTLPAKFLFLLNFSPCLKLYRTDFLKMFDLSVFNEAFFLKMLIKAERVSAELECWCQRQVNKADFVHPEVFVEQEEMKQLLIENGMWLTHKDIFIRSKINKIYRAVLNAPENEKKEMFSKMKQSLIKEDFEQYDINELRQDKTYFVVRDIATLEYDDFVLRTTNMER